MVKVEHQQCELPASPGTELSTEGGTYPLLILAPAERPELPLPHVKWCEKRTGQKEERQGGGCWEHSVMLHSRETHASGHPHALRLLLELERRLPK